MSTINIFLYVWVLIGLTTAIFHIITEIKIRTEITVGNLLEILACLVFGILLGPVLTIIHVGSRVDIDKILRTPVWERKKEEL